jgi:pimeloyl-ACP methyl ester carboxylesterase
VNEAQCWRSPADAEQLPRNGRAVVTVVLVHGMPETPAIWRPLQEILDRDVLAVGLPGFGAARTAGFSGTKDAYAEWLREALGRVEEPVDVVAHDLGALLTMRVASAFDVALRSWTVDVADIFHPRFAWPQRVRELQTPGLGEQMLKTSRKVDREDPRSSTSRLIAGGVPDDLAWEIGSAHDELMSRSILDFYRSAAPNVADRVWRTCTQL